MRPRTHDVSELISFAEQADGSLRVMPIATHQERLPILALQALSRVRTCPLGCPSCAAYAALALGEPVARCPNCSAPHLPDLGLCPCHLYDGALPNPATAALHAASKGRAGHEGHGQR